MSEKEKPMSVTLGKKAQIREASSDLSKLIAHLREQTDHLSNTMTQMVHETRKGRERND